MRVWHVVLVAAAVAALTGCGDDNSAGGSAATAPAATAPASTRPSNLGCDVVAQCFPEPARATLERCPPSRLDARGREARRRLEKLLARIADVARALRRGQLPAQPRACESSVRVRPAGLTYPVGVGLMSALPPGAQPEAVSKRREARSPPRLRPRRRSGGRV